MSKSIVVIGSNSFSGADFVDYCLEENMNVIGISRSPEPNDIFLPYKKNPENFTFHQLDLNHHLDQIIEIIKTTKAEYVVNYAAQSMVAQSWENPGHWFQTNTLSNVLLHDELRKLDFIKKYVHISTPEVYGNCQGNVTEEFPYNPSTPYAVSRAAADMSLTSFHKAYNFPVSFTRAANVFGPGQQLYRIIPRSIIYFLTGRKLQLHGGGTSVRSFIHIRDVSEGTLKVVKEESSGEIYHFSTDRYISIYDLVKLICSKLDMNMDDCVEVSGERLGKDSYYQLSSEKARSVLNWQPDRNLESGVDETIQWVKSNLETIKNLPLNYIHKA